MAASPEYAQVLRVVAALRASGLVWDANTYEETIGDGEHAIDFKERDLKTVPIEVAGLYDSVRAAWGGVDYVQQFVDRELRRTYSVKFVDSATACFQCSLKGGKLVKQRVAYSQSPFFKSYDAEELYQCFDGAAEIGLDEYWNLFGYHEPRIREIASLRYDFDPARFKVKAHPMAHLHLGESESCRICTESPPDVRSFFTFLVAQFYSRKLGEFEEMLQDWNGYTRFPQSIHAEEQPLPFFSWGKV